MIKTAVSTAVVVAVLGAAVAALGYSGAYDIAADEPHWSITARALGTIRERSIAVRAEPLQVPNLADPAMISLGAEHYAEMCTGCHLAPAMAETEMAQGLYPKPPNLAQRRARSPAESFWIIKHGIKMSAMPAWGSSHDDQTLWAIVAFLQQLPTLDAKEYATLTGAPDTGDDDHDVDDHDHEHGGITMDQAPAGEHVHAHGKEHGADSGETSPHT